MANQVRVFVSHHHSPEEDAFTARLVKDLEAAGADVWVDDKGISSDDFIEKISEGLEGRQWLVLVMTPHSVASPWVRREVNTALNEHTARRMLGVIPIVVMPTAEQDIPMLWRPLHRYDATQSYELARDGLLRALDLLATNYSLPELPVRLASLGFRGVNVSGTPAIVPPLITIPAGPFYMGSDDSDKQAVDNEKPQHRVELAAFQIGKYPVTVAEYALAVRAGAVRKPLEAYMSRNTLGINVASVDESAWWTQLQHPTCPVVCVSWQDASAYVAWLQGATGERGWRLPSEAEWEKAARWDAARGVSRIYPWGNSFDKARCNTGYSGIETTTPVGAYPATDPGRSGASSFGVEEMVGNVWEWTSSLFKPYPYLPSSNRENKEPGEERVLRGSSWTSFASYNRAAFRGRYSYVVFNHLSGFRLVLLPRASS